MVELTINFTNVDPDVLPLCRVGEHVNLWTAPENEYIYFFARRSIGSQGRIAKMAKDKVPLLTDNLDQTSTEILAVEGGGCKIMCYIPIDPPLT